MYILMPIGQKPVVYCINDTIIIDYRNYSEILIKNAGLVMMGTKTETKVVGN